VHLSPKKTIRVPAAARSSRSCASCRRIHAAARQRLTERLQPLRLVAQSATRDPCTTGRRFQAEGAGRGAWLPGRNA
jgi:hypothetical protein